MLYTNKFGTSSVLGLAVVLSLPLPGCESKPRLEKTPNIIHIYLDDMGYGDLEITGAYGYETPNLNKMVSQGMFFSNFYAPQAICSPSRAGLMTGCYPSRVGFGLNVGPNSNRGLSSDEMTIAGLLKQKGYKTAIYGKWHLGFQDPFLPTSHGFDEFYGIPYSNDMWPLHPEIPDRNPDLPMFENKKIVNPAITPDDQKQFTTVFTERTIDFIERNKNEPLFVYYPMNLTHWPFEPTPDSPDWDPTARLGDTAERGGKGDEKYFGDMVEYADKLVGQVIDKLEGLGLRDNTLVIFTSDNGTEQGVTSIVNGEEFVGGKLTSTDAGTHVALIANWPGVISEGIVNDDLICFTYFFPTLAEIAVIELPPDLELDGQSFAPLLYGEKADLRDWLYMWWYRNNDPDGPGDEFARTHRYKYYQDGRLYDLYEDPLEENPVPKSELDDEQKEVKNKLSGIINEYTRQGFYDQ